MNLARRAVSRRTALGITALMLSATALSACSQTGSTTAGASGSGRIDPKNLVMVSEVRSLTNPYEAAWVKGSQAYADSLSIPLKTIVYDGDSQQALSQLQSVLAGNKKVILNINPNTTADTPAIVNAVKKAGGYVVTQWSKPDNLNPWDVGNNWVAYVSYDGVTEGYDTGKTLAQSMGGTGGVIALQGLLANDISKARFSGLQKALAENKGVTLLDNQPADFDRNKAYSVTKTLLTKYGDKVNGIWAATDSMALGAMQAVSEAGKLGKIKIASAADATDEGLAAIQKGDMVASYSTDPYFNGAMGLALGYQAATGKLDVATLSHADRSFYVKQFEITKDNVSDYLTAPAPAAIVKSVDDVMSRNVGPIQ